MSRYATVVLAFAALVGAPHLSFANPADAFGLGARGSSMGGAQTAAANDSSANYYNPALLVRLREIHIDVGYRLAAPKLKIGGSDLGVDSSRGTHLGLAVPGELGPIAVAIGAGVFLPDQHLSRVRSLPPGQPRFSLYDNRPQRLLLAANVSVQLGERVSIGGGIAYMSNTSGGVVLGGRLGFPNADDSELDLDIDVALKTIRYPQAGLAIEVNRWLVLGASYRGQFNLVSDLRVRLEGDIGPEASPIVEDGFLDLRSITQDLFQPMQVTVGAAVDAGHGWHFAFDLAFHRWSALDNPAAQIELELDIGQFNDLVDIPAPRTPPRPRFHDIVVPRLGLEGQLLNTDSHTLIGRVGYSYEPTVAPEQTGETNFVDNDKHTASLGLGLDVFGLGAIVPKTVSFDTYASVTWLPERTHRKLSPVDPIGEYTAGGAIFAIGASSRWRF